MVPSSIDYFYGEYGNVESIFLAELDKSLAPLGPDMLYDIVAALRLEPSAHVLDLGCGDGKYAFELARRFGFDVLGVDPLPRPVAPDDQTLKQRVRIEPGRAERLPVADASIDLIWCRDMLVHVEDLAGVLAECRRVLHPGGRMLVLHSLATNRMASDEAAWLWAAMHVVPKNTDAAYFESTLSDAGFRIQQCLDVGSEWREYREESTGQSRLLHAARMLRQPDRYIAQFGKAAYDIMLGDCYWHVYQLLGKLSYRIYVLDH